MDVSRAGELFAVARKAIRDLRENGMCLHKHRLLGRFPRLWKSMQSSQEPLFYCCTLIWSTVGRNQLSWVDVWSIQKTALDQTDFYDQGLCSNFVTFYKCRAWKNGTVHFTASTWEANPTEQTDSSVLCLVPHVSWHAFFFIWYAALDALWALSHIITSREAAICEAWVTI